MQDNEQQRRGTADDGEASASSLPEAMALLRRRLKLIVAVAVTIAAASVAMALLLPRQYEAVSTVLIESRAKTVAPVGRVVDALRVNTPAIESQVEIAASNTVALRVIKNLKLRTDLEFAASPAAAMPGPGQRDPVLADIRSRLQVRRRRNTNLIEIAFTAGSAEKAAKIANGFAQAYVAFELEQKIKQSELATGFLAKKLRALRDKVVAADYKVERFKALNDIFDAEGQLLSEKKLARLMEQTVVARGNTAKARSRHEQIKKLIRTGAATGTIADVLQSHTVRMLKDQQAKLTGHQAELATKYGPKHPSMRKAGAEVRDIEAQLKAEIDRIVYNQKNEHDVARNREKTLARDIAALKKLQIREKLASVTLKELKRQAGTSRQLYEAILGRYKETAATQSMQLPDSRIVEAAAVPLRPSSPKRIQMIVIGVVAGIAAAIGLAFLLEFMAGGFARSREVDGLPALEQLASLPAFAPAEQEPGKKLRAIRRIIAEPDGRFAEAITDLRRQLDARPPAGRVPAGKKACNIILVVSTLPREGRSIVASNLAHDFSLSGKDTLLIDADLRRAGLTQDLAPGAHAGLLDCLGAGIPLRLAVLRDCKTGLSFLPARSNGASRITATEALRAPQTARRLKQLRAQYGTIIVDCPPILPVADARIIAEHADQILFVMAAKRTPKDLARRAVRLLGSNATKIIGVVVNQIETIGLGAESVTAAAHDSAMPANVRKAA